MFDQHHLLKHGVAGQGVVTSHKEIDHDQYGGELDYSIHVRVRFEDGTETEIVHRWTKRTKVGSLRVGDLDRGSGPHRGFERSRKALEASGRSACR